MSGRFKFVDSSGNAINAEDFPEIQYEYDVPSDYDQSCGTVGLEDFQLPNPQCPDKFVCDQPGGKVGKYAECVDSMNCAMLVGMTTNVYQNNAIALFNHQMIPHHQNAVNMCKSLFKSGEVECDDVEDEEDPSCVITVLCHEIINVQNFQIQTMRGVLDALDLPQEDDCVVPIEDDSTSPPKTPVPSEPAPKQFKITSFVVDVDHIRVRTCRKCFLGYTHTFHVTLLYTVSDSQKVLNSKFLPSSRQFYLRHHTSPPLLRHRSSILFYGKVRLLLVSGSILVPTNAVLL
mmetsp:Transcript_44438/g.92549  ORF Transcript_44438/g.92549 Transcript_44438/m.92549 type:complete len:289 (+) Transcript_44438:1598-2464(+)